MEEPEAMKVLVLGFSRTGTQPLADALDVLGYKGVYHMREVGKNGHAPFWTAALKAKRDGGGKVPGREEFEEVLGGYEALGDLPAAAFYAELVSAYPDARLILTTRPEEVWFASMNRTLIHSWASQPKDKDGPMKELDNELQLLWEKDFERKVIECFRTHNAGVLEVTEGKELLTFEVKQGWGPLCEFLGKEIPDVPFPRADDWVEYKKVQEAEG